MQEVKQQPTTVLFARVPQSVRDALERFRIEDRRTISAAAAILLEIGLQQRGYLPIEAILPPGDGKGAAV